MSVNIELPSSSSLKLLAPQKSKNSILKPMSFIGSEILSNIEERRLFKNAPAFVPAGQSTQLIVGATNDSDFKIIKLSESLYNTYNLKRVYYSAYVPINRTSKLPDIIKPPLLREHRLYQADWLLRFYGFSANELLSDNNPNFDINFDPKTNYALSHLEKFPVEVNLAPRNLLLRVPGIGMRSVQRILAARKVHSLTFQDLKKLGVVLKRAQYFITCSGKYYGDTAFEEENIRKRLMPKVDFNIIENKKYEQLTFFSALPVLYKPEDSFTSINGEI
jgi:putative DNA modification/repair radical SAM protein